MKASICTPAWFRRRPGSQPQLTLSDSGGYFFFLSFCFSVSLLYYITFACCLVSAQASLLFLSPPSTSFTLWRSLPDGHLLSQFITLVLVSYTRVFPWLFPLSFRWVFYSNFMSHLSGVAIFANSLQIGILAFFFLLSFSFRDEIL